MSATNSAYVNYKNYKISNALTHEQANNLIIQNAVKCPEIKKVTPTAANDNVVAFGKYYSYTVNVKNSTVRLKTKFNYTLAMFLAFLCTPFALWFAYEMDVTDFDFTKLALPLGLLLLTYGIVFSIAYLLGNREQKVILPYIHDTLAGILEKSPKMGISADLVSALAAGIAGIIILVIRFM